MASASPLVDAQSPPLVDPRSPPLESERMGSQLEALRSLGRHAAGGLHADELARVEDVARDAFKAALATHSAMRQRDFAASLRSALPEVTLPATLELGPLIAEVKSVRGAVSDLADLLGGGFAAQRAAIEASKVAIRADLDAVYDQVVETSAEAPAAPSAPQLASFQRDVKASLDALAEATAQRAAATEAALRALQHQAEVRDAAAATAQAASDARLDRLEAAVVAILGASNAVAAQVAALAQGTQEAAARGESSTAALAAALGAGLASVADDQEAARARSAGELASMAASLQGVSAAVASLHDSQAGSARQLEAVQSQAHGDSLARLASDVSEGTAAAVAARDAAAAAAAAARDAAMQSTASAALTSALTSALGAHEQAVVRQVDALEGRLRAETATDAAAIEALKEVVSALRYEGALRDGEAAERTAALRAAVDACAPDVAARVEAGLAGLESRLPSAVASVTVPLMTEAGASVAAEARSAVCAEVARGTVAVHAALASAQAETAHAIASGVADAATGGADRTLAALRDVRDAVAEAATAATGAALEPLKAGVGAAARSAAAELVAAAEAAQTALVARIVAALPDAAAEGQRRLALATAAELRDAVREATDAADAAVTRIEVSVARRVHEEGSALDASLAAHVSSQLERVHAALAGLAAQAGSSSSSVTVNAMSTTMALATSDRFTAEVASLRSELRAALAAQTHQTALLALESGVDARAASTLQELRSDVHRIHCLVETTAAGQAQVMAAAAAARASGLTADPAPAEGLEGLRRAVADVVATQAELLRELRRIRGSPAQHPSSSPSASVWPSPAQAAAGGGQGHGARSYTPPSTHAAAGPHVLLGSSRGGPSPAPPAAGGTGDLSSSFVGPPSDSAPHSSGGLLGSSPHGGSLLGSRRGGAHGSSTVGLLEPSDAFLSPHRQITSPASQPLLSPLLAASSLPSSATPGQRVRPPAPLDTSLELRVQRVMAAAGAAAATATE